MPKADLGKVMAGKYFGDQRVKSTWLKRNRVVICLHFRPLVCLIRQMKCALSNYTANVCPGLAETSGRRMAPTAASIQRLSAGPTPSSRYVFFHFSLGSFAFCLLCAQAFVSFLLSPSILVGWRTAWRALGRDGAGIHCCSKVMCPRRGCLHDLLANFANLQLQTDFGGEGVQMASLEGSSGLTWRGEKGHAISWRQKMRR